jgi:hypothetical protein
MTNYSASESDAFFLVLTLLRLSAGEELSSSSASDAVEESPSSTISSGSMSARETVAKLLGLLVGDSGNAISIIK